MAEAVYQMIARAVDAGCGQILLSDPGRPPFLAVAEACVDDFYAELLPVEANGGGFCCIPVSERVVSDSCIMQSFSLPRVRGS